MIFPTLEKYSGKTSRHTCPNCGKNREFTRYVKQDGSYIADNVGKCNRASCGYHYSPKRYFADNSTNADKLEPTIRSHGIRLGRQKQTVIKPDYLDPEHLAETIGGYEENAFVRFLVSLFPNDPEDVFQAIKVYIIGTKDGFTSFPTITSTGKLCKAKLIKFDPATGKRIKDGYSISSLEAKLKRPGLLKENFETDKEVFFGEHLLGKFPGRPVSIVESEKSAVIGSICKGVFPDMVWLAAGSLSWLNADRVARLGRDRKIILYPDTDIDGKCISKWQVIASEARKRGFSVYVSDLIEKNATVEEKAKGYDLADYLIREQSRRNDPALQEDFRTIIEDRLAILTVDGGMSEREAEDHILSSGFYQIALSNVLRQRS
jgi:hypothetical protein